MFIKGGWEDDIFFYTPINTKNEKGTKVDNGECITAKPFYSTKSIIEEGPLFNVFREMPKGGLLYVHSSAALSIECYKELLPY